MIDIHCHLLYGVDDGAGTIEESVAMLKEAREHGIHGMILTPHYRHGMFSYPKEEIEEHFMQLKPYAEKLGIGSADLTRARIIDVNGGRAEQALPAEKKHLAVSYAVDEVDSCSACYASLVPALDRLEEEGLLEKLRTKIAIGQGHQGEKGELGIGKCTKDFAFCVMGCPPDEEKIYREIRRYIEEHGG